MCVHACITAPLPPYKKKPLWDEIVGWSRGERESVGPNLDSSEDKLPTAMSLTQLGSSCCSAAQSCPTHCDPGECSSPVSLSFTISRSLGKLTSLESVMPSNQLILCHPLLLLPSIFPASGSFPMNQLFTSKVAKVLELQHQSFRWLSVLISFRMDWLDLLAVQGTLKRLLQLHN